MDIDNLESRVTNLEKLMQRSHSDYPKVVDRIARLEGSVDELRNSVTDLKEMSAEIKVLSKLMVQVQCGIDNINGSIGSVSRSLEKQGARIGTLEGQSGNNAKSAIKWFATTIGSIVIGAIMGVLVAKIGLTP